MSECKVIEDQEGAIWLVEVTGTSGVRIPVPYTESLRKHFYKQRDQELERIFEARLAAKTANALTRLAALVSRKENEWDRKSGRHAAGMSLAAAKIRVYIAEQIDDLHREAADNATN